MEEKISIIVPAYNNAPWLPRCLDSILSQTHKNFEAIVVDDGSTDNTGELLRQYHDRDSRIIPLRQENAGVTSARLHGIRKAGGDWICFVDGDDWVEPEMFERLLRNALKHQADISHCGVQRNFPDGRVDFYYNTGYLLIEDRSGGLRELLSGQRVEPGLVCKLFHRRLFSGLEQTMDPSIKINEDLLMNYYLFCKAGRSVFDDFCPYHYMMRKGSASSAQWSRNKLEDPLKVTKLMMADQLPFVSDLLMRRYVRQLIYSSTLCPDTCPEFILPYRLTVRRELQSSLGRILASPVGVKLKLMALWVAVWPASYDLIHRTYTKLSGISRKYSV